MALRPAVRDSRLIDGLDALPRAPFEGTVWRAVRKDRDPRQCSASGGRWDDGGFDVLYTALDRDGGIAEMYFHLLRGQPVFPSRVQYCLHELKVELSAILHLAALPDLAALGFDTSRYGQLSCAGKNQEYLRTQEIAEVAHFLDCDGLLVPSARWPCGNLVLFCGRVGPDAIEAVKDHGIIGWTSWQQGNKVKL